MSSGSLSDADPPARLLPSSAKIRQVGDVSPQPFTATLESVEKVCKFNTKWDRFTARA
jgi:hypothetical protein